MTSTAKFVPGYYRTWSQSRMWTIKDVLLPPVTVICFRTWHDVDLWYFKSQSIYSTCDFSSHNMNQIWTREVAPKWHCKTYREVLSHIGRASGIEEDQCHTLYTAAHGVSAAGILPFSMIRGPSAKKWGFWHTHIRLEEKFLPHRGSGPH